MAETSSPADRTALRLAALLGVSGALHFAIPKSYDAIVPRTLPGGARCYTYASGVAELAVAGALAAPRARRLGGMAAAGLFTAIFPANVQMALDWLRNPKVSLPLKAVGVLRLPLQIPLIIWSLRVSRHRRGGCHCAAAVGNEPDC